MEEDHKKQIEEIMSSMKCPRDFRCCKSELNPLCKAKGSPMKNFVDIEETPPPFVRIISEFWGWAFM